MNFKYTIECDKCHRENSGDKNSIYISAYSCTNCSTLLSKSLTTSCNFCRSEIVIDESTENYHRCGEY